MGRHIRPNEKSADKVGPVTIQLVIPKEQNAYLDRQTIVLVNYKHRTFITFKIPEGNWFVELLGWKVERYANYETINRNFRRLKVRVLSPVKNVIL
jgi:hypothetical protein